MNLSNKDLGKNLKAYRELSGYSQKQLSALCGISRQSLHNHKNGKARPTTEHLANYARVLGISATELEGRIHPRAWIFKVFDTLAWEKVRN